MTNSNDDSPQGQKGHLNQNVVIAIIGAVATLLAAIIPWALDRAAKAEPVPTTIQATFTDTVPLEATATNTAIAMTPSLTPTLEPPTVTATATEETGIYNAFLARDFEGLFIDTNFTADQTIHLFFNINDPENRNIVKVVVSVVKVPGFLAGAVPFQIEDKMVNPSMILVISNGNLKAGFYKVDIYLNNILDETIEFEVTP